MDNKPKAAPKAAKEGGSKRKTQGAKAVPASTDSQTQQPLPQPRPRAVKKSESVQLVRPTANDRELASQRAVDILEANFELARDLGPVERALLPANTTFRVVGALGSSLSGRTHALSATLFPSSLQVFPQKSTGLHVFVQSDRRVLLVAFPPWGTPGRRLNAPVFAPLVNPSKFYDLRVAVSALVSCQVVLLSLSDAEDGTALFSLVSAATKLVRARNWPCAQILLVRSFVGENQGARRVQCDERALRDVVGGDMRDADVFHIPKGSLSWDTNRRLAHRALGGLASRGMRVPQSASSRATEAEWLASLVFVFNETRTHPFFLAAEQETVWLGGSGNEEE